VFRDEKSLDEAVAAMETRVQDSEGYRAAYSALSGEGVEAKAEALL